MREYGDYARHHWLLMVIAMCVSFVVVTLFLFVTPATGEEKSGISSTVYILFSSKNPTKPVSERRLRDAVSHGVSIMRSEGYSSSVAQAIDVSTNDVREHSEIAALKNSHEVRITYFIPSYRFDAAHDSSKAARAYAARFVKDWKWLPERDRGVQLTVHYGETHYVGNVLRAFSLSHWRQLLLAFCSALLVGAAVPLFGLLSKESRIN